MLLINFRLSYKIHLEELLNVFKEAIIIGLQETIKALADPTRREILNMLKQRKMSAGEIVDSFDMTGASISRHLSILKNANLIRDSKQGKYIYYEINLSFTEEVLEWISSFTKE